MLNISLAVLDDKIFENNMIKCISSYGAYILVGHFSFMELKTFKEIKGKIKRRCSLKENPQT